MTIIDRRHSVSEGTAIKAPCHVATTANIVLAGEQAIDGQAVTETMPPTRVLVKDQTDATTNGIYDVSTGNWTRARDFDGAFDVVNGTLVRITNGETNVGFWEVATSNPVEVDSTSIRFALTTSLMSGLSSYFQTLLSSVSATVLFQNFIDTISLRGLLDMLTAEPTGVIHAYAGTSAPSGYLFCRGQVVSRITYAALFATIGTTYGAGDGSTTFLVPDLAGRVLAGKETLATRLTSGASGIDGATLGATGGAQTHILTIAQMPSHTHTFTGSALPPHTHTTTAPDIQSGGNAGGNGLLVGGDSNHVSSAVSSGTPAGANSSTGEGGAHVNVQPTIILNYIIKT